MNSSESEVTLESLAERFDALVDLFKRRLLEDRAKQAVIEDLQKRLTRAENALSASALKPVVDGLSLIIERLQATNPEDDLRVVEELEYVLESVLGVACIRPIQGEKVDPTRHEVVSASGVGRELRVSQLLRTGYEKDGVVLRAAKITALHAEAEADASGRGSSDG